jgi:prepilin-type processing-associated H-X9-DG protein
MSTKAVQFAPIAYREAMMMKPSVTSARRLRVLAVGITSLALVLSACSSGAKKTPASGPSSGTGSASASSSSSAPSSSAAPSPPAARPVHIRLLNSDGATYGVGMPIIAYFSAKITNAKAFANATTVKVNGTPAVGAWYFEASALMTGYPLEAHYRLQNYWPAHASITMDMATTGVSAGTGLAFDDSLTLSEATGAANISYVDGHTEKMTVTSDGTTVMTMPVSLGKARTPTYIGTKVVMQKGQNSSSGALLPIGEVRMIGPGYNELVPWSVRVTNSGEYVHAASWNGGNIGIRSTSNGCTNLNTGNAQAFYNFSKIGDVVLYTNTGGATMPSWDGLGDWNVAWSTWRAGGVVSTS